MQYDRFGDKLYMQVGEITGQDLYDLYQNIEARAEYQPPKAEEILHEIREEALEELKDD